LFKKQNVQEIRRKIKQKEDIMKKMNIQLAVLTGLFFMLFTISPAVASENVEVNAVEDTKKVKVELDTPASESINVMVYNRFGRVVFDDMIAKGSVYEDVIDFSEMRRGSYKLVSQSGNSKYSRVLEVDKNGVALIDGYNAFAPSFDKRDNMVLIQLLNMQDENIRIIIEDELGKIYEDYHHEPGKLFSMAYAMDYLPENNYTIYLMKDIYRYSYDFTVD